MPTSAPAVAERFRDATQSCVQENERGPISFSRLRLMVVAKLQCPITNDELLAAIQDLADEGYVKLALSVSDRVQFAIIQR